MSYISLFTSTTISTEPTLAKQGGKGYNLIKMKKSGYNVPSGLVISTSACNAYRILTTEESKKHFMGMLLADVSEYLGEVYQDTPHRLLSVRSGAEVSMAGMMDTILNVGVGYEGHGLESASLEVDCIKRFTDMFVDVVLENKDTLTDTNRQTFFESIIKHNPKPIDVIGMCIEAVFKSWDNERAKHYRKMYNISDDLGTAVVIQSMVFGNYNDNSGSGVAFTRNPNTGVNKIMGEFLINCQGEDVVSGAHTPLTLKGLHEWNGQISEELADVCLSLEIKNKDMQDIEFTVQDGELFILQTRNGKRSALAEVVIALDLFKEGLIPTLSSKISSGCMLKLEQPTLPPNFKKKSVLSGIPSGGYLATGRVCNSVQEVLDCNEPAILVAEETTPDDIKGMEKAVGILTQKGGATSHAAVVARGMNKPCVVGCTDLALVTVNAVHYVMIDGQTGKVWFSEKPFEVDTKTKIPVDALSPIIMEAVTEDTWVLVKDVDEAIALEDYLYNVVLPVKGLSMDTLEEIAPKFNHIVLTTNTRPDVVSDFLGKPEGSDYETLEGLSMSGLVSGIPNVSIHDDGIAGLPRVKHFKTMADVMNGDFVGIVCDDFINDVMGGEQTFDLIREQVDLDSRIFSDTPLLEVLENWVKIG